MGQEQGLTLGAGAIAVLVAAIGFIGVLVGAYVASRNQRKLWIADNKRSEYRKLLTTLTRTFLSVVRLHSVGVTIEPRERRKLFSLEIEALAVIRDRLFISEEIEEMNLLRRWIDAMHNYDHLLDYDGFASEFGFITRDIKNRAGEIYKEKDWMEWLDESSFCADMKEMQGPRE
jgi:hypothetical protein